MGECSLESPVPEPLASHFTLPSRASTTCHRPQPRTPDALRLAGRTTKVGVPSLTGFFCGPELLGQMLFNYNAEQGQLEAIPRDSSGSREPIPKFPDTSEL